MVCPVSELNPQVELAPTTSLYMRHTMYIQNLNFCSAESKVYAFIHIIFNISRCAGGDKHEFWGGTLKYNSELVKSFRNFF
jgi:hypothetical protein